MTTDFAVTNHGSIYLFRPISEEAVSFALEAFESAQTLGAAYAVEHRYAHDIIGDLVGAQGFSVTLDGFDVRAR